MCTVLHQQQIPASRGGGRQTEGQQEVKREVYSIQDVSKCCKSQQQAKNGSCLAGWFRWESSNSGKNSSLGHERREGQGSKSGRGKTAVQRRGNTLGCAMSVEASSCSISGLLDS